MISAAQGILIKYDVCLQTPKCTDVSVKGNVWDRGTLTKLISGWKYDKSVSAALLVSVAST